MHGLVRRLSLLDRLLVEAGHALATSLGTRPVAQRTNPATNLPSSLLNQKQRRHAAGLMRINHAGEVCAQALYLGQASVAHDAATREQLLHAAAEETDHLAWCHERLDELASRPSRLNPLWYAGAYAIGLVAGWRGDGWNLGFVVETERQVEAHLDDHLGKSGLPLEDARSRAIVQAMKTDEARHAATAEAAGARTLPAPIPTLMALVSKAMKAVAYRI